MANLGKLKVHNTSELRSPNTRFCTMLAARPKVGKTTLAGSLDAFTKKVRGKPTLFIAVEAAEGGGTMSIADMGVDYVTPANYSDMEELLKGLATDATYGGIVLDNGTDYVQRIVKPYSLNFPSKESDPGTRKLGVPVRGDYQTIAEAARKHFNALINLSNDNTPENFRKDILVTCLEKDKLDNSGSITDIIPDFPGALSAALASMFQSVLSIRTRQKVLKSEDGKPYRLVERYLQVAPDGLRQVGDRTKIFKDGRSLTADNGDSVGLLEIWNEWVQ